MRSTTITRAAAALGAAGVITMLSISPAAAEQSIEFYVDGARANFDAYAQPRGEAIRIKDKATDGLGARAYLYWGTTKTASVTVTRGAGHTAEKDLAIREGTTVDLQICYVNSDGVDVKCSKTRRGEA